MSKLDAAPVYKAHRIHATRLYSRPYVSLIVSIGKRQPMTKDSLTWRRHHRHRHFSAVMPISA
jgi:hypothetical protein